MARVDNASQLASIIRAQLAAANRLRGQAPKPGRGKASPQHDEDHLTSAESDQAAETAAGGAVSRLITQRVGALRADDPQRERKAFRVFLESVLVQEFGIALIDDTGFQQLVEQVQEQMESDAELRGAMQEAAALLLAQADGGGTPHPKS